MNMELGVEEYRSSRCIVIRVSMDRLLDVVKKLIEVRGARYSTSVGIDYRLVNKCFRVIHLFALDRESKYIAIAVDIEGESRVPSITRIIPGADWAEREIRELLGIEFEGHPSREPLIKHRGLWPDVYPLRKDYPYNKKMMFEPIAGEVSDTIFAVPLGPYHAALHEPEYFELVVDGEKIVEARYRGFMVHRGIEKLAESKLNIFKIPFIAERICGICGFTHSTAFCQAIEDALGVEAPPRARYIRSLLLEIERLHSHLLWFGVLFHVLGFETGFMVCWRIREKVMEIAELLTGNRKTYGMNIPGGVRKDVDSDKLRKTLQVVEQVEHEIRKYLEKMLKLSEVVDRTRSVGILSREDAKKLSVVGPTARASGIDIDVRRDHPYAAYSDVEFDVPVRDEGDVYARAVVRLLELYESIRIVKQLIEAMPSGDIRTEIDRYRELAVGLGATEAPRGENVHFVLTSRDGMVYRWKVRAPSYNNIPATLLMLEGEYLGNAPIIIASIDPCFSCTDRVIVIDRRTGSVRRLSIRELARGG